MKRLHQSQGGRCYGGMIVIRNGKLHISEYWHFLERAMAFVIEQSVSPQSLN
jgi:hypothetical protein